MATVNLTRIFEMSSPINVVFARFKPQICYKIFGYKFYGTKRRDTVSQDSPLKNMIDESATYIDKNIIDSDDKWATLPYSQLPEELLDNKPKVDPRQTSVIMFPGQGSQFIGMGQDLERFPVARKIYRIANEILDLDLKKICFEGPQELLNKHCQLAVMVTSLAACERLKEERPSAIEKCSAVAGFSLGEITALVFAGALGYEEALRLVQIRATAMEAAAAENPGGMITVFFRPDARIGEAVESAVHFCQDKGVENAVCTVANYLFPGCKVVSGSELAIRFLEENGSKYGIKNTKRIPVTGPFHCELMRSAVEPFRAALKLCQVEKPLVTVVSSMNAQPYKSAHHITSQLPRQIIQPVKWEQCMHLMFTRKQGSYFPQIIAMGPGESLRTILRKLNGPAWDCCIPIKV